MKDHHFGHMNISIRGARTHNLKNIDIEIPRHQLVVITGLSGSGKSSLAFDTLYAEGQRRYVESLSAYARQFLQLMDKPDVDVIEGLSPAIAIEQKSTSHNPRSTVGTVTEIHDYLRLLFARVGTPYCPEHKLPLRAQTVSQMVDAVLALPEGTRLMLLAPVARARKGEFKELFTQMQALGYVRFRVNGVVYDHENLPTLRKNDKHDVDVVIDRLRVRTDVQQRLAESFEAALRLSQGRALVLEMDAVQANATEAVGTTTSITPDGLREHWFNAHFACPLCSYSVNELEPRLFSFNSPIGACPACDGLGHQSVFDPQRVVSAPHLSLADGAIKGWDQRTPYYHSMLQALATHYRFDLSTPFEDLPKRVTQVVLYGSGEESIRFEYSMESLQAPASSKTGKTSKALRHVVKEHPFEGILPNMQRRWRDTESATVREELSRYRHIQPCAECGGARLGLAARHVRLAESSQAQALALHEVNALNLQQARAYFADLHWQGSRAAIAEKIVHEIVARLRFLNDVGLGYLSLQRSADTLSGGEAQRIRLASQIGSGLTGVMYVLDEPSIGLHQRDNARLIATLQHLRDLGNSVLVVEHDEDMMRAADHIIDLGPGAGVHGGQIMAQGDWQQISHTPQSLTGQYLSGAKTIAVPAHRTPWSTAPDLTETPPPATKTSKAPKASQTSGAANPPPALALRVQGAKGNNLKNVTVDFPLGLFTCVTGVSGSGKSTLVNDTLYAAAAQHIHRAHTEPAAHEGILGLELIDKVINVDQAPIGRTPRSNPATYTGLFTPLRELMAEVPMARERGYQAGRFSFNVSGGRCEACQGDGVVKVEMHFLPDVYVTCDVCQGQRYNRETLQILYKGRNIADILNMTVAEAADFFSAVPVLMRKLSTLMDVGLSYIRLGQSALTLSGGEAQRIKLALELSRRDTGRTLYILDEPTTGLHFADIALLLQVLQRLRDAGNTIIVIEHNLDVIKCADWLIDIGPEGGAGGGQVIGTGTPEHLSTLPESHTGRYLRDVL